MIELHTVILREMNFPYLNTNPRNVVLTTRVYSASQKHLFLKCPNQMVEMFMAYTVTFFLFKKEILTHMCFNFIFS